MRENKLLKNISFTFLYQIIAIVSGFIIPKAIMQNYGSNVNGLVSSITQFLAYIYLAEGGISVVIKYLLYKPIAKRDKNEIERILKSSQKFLRHILYIYMVYVGILCIIYPQIVAENFDKHFTIVLLIIIAISRYSEYFMAMEYNLFIQSNQEGYLLAIINSITVILNTIITILLIKLKCSIMTIKIANAIIFIVRAKTYKIYVRKKYKINLSKKIEKYEIKQKRDAFAHQIAYIIDTNIDVVLITCVLGTAEVSVYTVYMLVIKGIKNIVSAIIGGVDATFGDMFAKKEYENVNKKFTIYQFFYFNIISILYNLCLVLIIPFIQIYTKGITDANYYRPVFAMIITVSDFIAAIKLPYDTLISSIGHFKQTKKFAYTQAIINVVLSVILVIKFGIVGVAIGTLVAVIYKTCMDIYYFSKKILKRDIKVDLKFLVLIFMQSIIIILLGKIITKYSSVTGYFSWLILAIKLGIITVIIQICTSFALYKDLMQKIIEKIKENKKEYLV